MELEVIRFVNENSNVSELLEVMRDVTERGRLLTSAEERDLKFRLHMFGFSEEMTSTLFHYTLAVHALVLWARGFVPFFKRPSSFGKHI